MWILKKEKYHTMILLFIMDKHYAIMVELAYSAEKKILPIIFYHE